MRCAVVSVSREGAELGQSVRDALGGEITCYERKGAESGGEARLFQRTFALTEEIFPAMTAFCTSWRRALRSVRLPRIS